jgi:hypothetical protein
MLIKSTLSIALLFLIGGQDIFMIAADPLPSSTTNNQNAGGQKGDADVDNVLSEEPLLEQKGHDGMVATYWKGVDEGCVKGLEFRAGQSQKPSDNSSIVMVFSSNALAGGGNRMGTILADLTIAGATTLGYRAWAWICRIQGWPVPVSPLEQKENQSKEADRLAIRTAELDIAIKRLNVYNALGRDASELVPNMQQPDPAVPRADAVELSNQVIRARAALVKLMLEQENRELQDEQKKQDDDKKNRTDKKNENKNTIAAEKPRTEPVDKGASSNAAAVDKKQNIRDIQKQVDAQKIPIAPPMPAKA